MTAIYKREVKSLFYSLNAYVFISIYLILFGIYFRYYNLTSDMGAPSVGYPLFYCYWAFILFALLSMKALPEERKEKTDQLLYTAPVSVTSIVLGKYFAMITVWLVNIAVIATCPPVIKHFGNCNYKVDYSMIAVYFLLGCAYIAVCMFISSLTESQLIAAVISILVVFANIFAGVISGSFTTSAYVSLIFLIVVCAVFGLVAWVLSANYIVGFASGIVLSLVTIILYIVKKSAFEGLVIKILNTISLNQYLSPFVFSETFDIKAVVLYLSVIVLFIFFTVQSLQKRRYS